MSSAAMQIVLGKLAKGVTKAAIAADIGYSPPAVSRYVSESYGAGVEKIEAAIVKAYDRRICPEDGEQKAPSRCRQIAYGPQPHGFPDAEARWRACQTCPHKPTPTGAPSIQTAPAPLTKGHKS